MIAQLVCQEPVLTCILPQWDHSLDANQPTTRGLESRAVFPHDLLACSQSGLVFALTTWEMMLIFLLGLFPCYCRCQSRRELE